MKFTSNVECLRVFVSSRSSRVVGRSGARRESVYRAFNREKSHCTRLLVPRVPRVMSGDRYLVLISTDIPRSSADFRSVFRVVIRNRRRPQRSSAHLVLRIVTSFRARRAKSNRTWKVVMRVARRASRINVMHISVRALIVRRACMRVLSVYVIAVR
jgi:hypothetical protein